MSTKPSLYEYYMKLIPDTVIFDEIERIAWQNNITCGTFDGSGRVDDIQKSTDISLFFFADNLIDKTHTWSTRGFFKIYLNGETEKSTIKSYIHNQNDNIIVLDKNLNEVRDDDKENEYCYIIVDSSFNNIYQYHEMSIKFSDKCDGITVVGVKF